MNRRTLKYYVAATLFSTAFFIGDIPVDAYTYDNVNLTSDKLNEDSEDLKITNNSQVNISTSLKPMKSVIKKIEYKDINGIDAILAGQPNPIINPNGDDAIVLELKNIPTTMSINMYNDFLNVSNNSQKLTEFNKKYGTQITFSGKSEIDSTAASTLNYWKDFMKGFTFTNSTLQFAEGYAYRNQTAPVWLYRVKNNSSEKLTYYDFAESNDSASITISNKSTLSVNGRVRTDKDISVIDNSHLDASDEIIGGNIYSDGAIISTTKYLEGSITTPLDITATGTLKSDTYIGAVNGIVSGNMVYSGGDIVSATSIETGGLAKGNVLNVAAINAGAASITGNQSISGIFTTSGQAKLNGGAALGNKKITRLSAGTLSAASTDAVNGSQLNTIKQKLSSAGKTYSAGSDVAISSANAISVSKNGVVDKGNKGIVTGGAVYKITSALNSSLNTLKASVDAHQSTLFTLTQGLSDLKASVTNINQSVASATRSLSSQLTNRLQSDMGNLSADGKNVIKSMVSSTLKSMNSMSVPNTISSPVATYEADADTAVNATEQISIDDVSAIQKDLTNKVDTRDFTSLGKTVSHNTKQLASNTENVGINEAAIASLKETKTDIDGGNMDTTKYAEKLGVGKVESGSQNLVTGDVIYGAMSQKADIGYVDAGLGMVSNQLSAMSQGLTQDMNRVGAGASALAGLHPSGYDPADKMSFATSYGHYKNANTSALGAFYHPNEKTMVSLAGTIGNKDAMLSAGVSIKLGMNHDVKQVMVTQKMFSAQQVINQGMKDQMDTQSEQLKQIEATLQSMMR